jgi:SHS2 domain-containing protein
MAYEYLEDIAISDVAFRVRSEHLESLFEEATEAVLNTMCEDPGSVEDKVHRPITLGPETAEMLLFQLLQEMIFFKDAEQELLRAQDVKIRETEEGFILSCVARGEKMEPERHRLLVDVKAVTFHRFEVQPVDGGWEATVVLDI